MFYITSSVKILKLGLNGSLEEGALDARYVTPDHSSLVHPVQDAGYRGEEIGFQYLSIFKKAEWIPSIVTDSSAKGYCAQFANSL